MADENPSGKSRGFLAKFTVLRGAAPELWLTFALKFLNIAAYGLTNVTISLWLSTEFGFSDQGALALVLAWSITMLSVTLLVGSLTDAIGLRRTFFAGVWVCLFARLVMVFATNKWLAIVGGLFPLAIGEALGTPVLVAAVQKYSTPLQRSISFSLIYMVMNLAFFVNGPVFDGVRASLGENGHWTLPILGLHLPTYRVLFLISAGVQLLMLPLVWLMRPGVEVTADGVQIHPPLPTRSGGSMFQALSASVVSAARDTHRLFAALFKQRRFYRLLAFLALIACLKLIYWVMTYVFPKFGIRELGPGAPVGKLQSINSGLIILLVPLVGALTQRYRAYGMAIVGSVLTAGSVFIMILPPERFQAMAASPVGQWLGHSYLGLQGDVHPYYVMIALFFTVYSFGEAFYSPRVYEYAASIAPKGQEASYASLSYIPNLLGKVLTTTVAGSLLARYCPETGPRHPETMWLVFALMATIAPIGLIVFRKVIRVHEAGRED